MARTASSAGTPGGAMNAKLRIPRDFTAREQVGRHRLHRWIIAGNLELWLAVLLVGRGLGVVQHHSHERFGFQRGWGRKRNRCFHSDRRYLSIVGGNG